MKIWIAASITVVALNLPAQEPPPPEQPREYKGPVILGRGAGASVTDNPEQIRFRPFLALNGVYDTGLNAVSVREDGNPAPVDSFGVEAVAGIYGTKAWKRTGLAVDYRGAYRHYTPATYFDGTDQSLVLALAHQPTKRVTLSLREAAGTFTRGVSLSNAYGLVDPLFANLPRDQLFDSRVTYMSTMGDVIYQKSLRTSWNLGADQFLIRYRSNALFGVTGTRARANAAYRYSRRGTMGVAYSFIHFKFTRRFGASDIHSVGLLHAVRLSRFWEWQFKLGASRVETLGTARVDLDPVIAAIIGQTVGLQALHRVNYVPDLEARLTRGFRRASLQFGYARGVSPGNGLYMTSASESVNVDYHYTGIRKWNLGMHAGYSSFNSLTLTLGKYKSYRAGAGATYQLARNLHLSATLDARQFEVNSLLATWRDYDRVFYRSAIGLAFSPGDLPLKLW